MVFRFGRLVLCPILALGCIFSYADSLVLSNTSATSTLEAVVSTTFHPDVFSEATNASERGTESIVPETKATDSSARDIDREALFYVTLPAVFGAFLIELILSMLLFNWTKNYNKYLEAKLLLLVCMQVFYSFLFLVDDLFSDYYLGVRNTNLPFTLFYYFGILMVLWWNLLASTNCFYLMQKCGVLSGNGDDVIIERPMILLALLCGYQFIFSLVIESFIFILGNTGAYSRGYLEINGYLFAIDFLVAAPAVLFVWFFVSCVIFYRTGWCDIEIRLITVKLYFAAIFDHGLFWFALVGMLTRLDALDLSLFCKMLNALILLVGICLARNIHRLTQRKGGDDEKAERDW